MTVGALKAINSVAVVGTGTIGASWTALLLSKGLRVVASDPAGGAELRLRQYVRQAWSTLSALQPGLETLESAEERLSFDVRLEDHLQKVDFVQENGPERLDYKKSIFELLQRKCRPGVVLASSSSGLPASAYATANTDGTGDGASTLVGHPFNPPHLIPLVEVVPHQDTAAEAVQVAEAFYRSLDREPVILRKESPGFVANRLQAALVHEAYSLVSRGYVTPADIDSVVSNSIALRWALQGPFITKVLGGGGGSDGFRHHLSHVGKAAHEWAKDMAQNAYKPTDDAENKLAILVDEQLAKMGSAKVERLPSERDAFLIELLRLKQKLSQNV